MRAAVAVEPLTEVLGESAAQAVAAMQAQLHQIRVATGRQILEVERAAQALIRLYIPPMQAAQAVPALLF